ncbi:MAG: helix-turn-helix domain-containing protein [Paludibacter sp.]|nr:helix-turn-helix domain-containing protein [Paludibacter sp.]
MQSLKNIHIGNIIRQKLKENSMSITDFANKIHCERTTVYDIFERKSIDSELLIRISEVLNFDFYNEIYLNKDTNNFSKKILIAFENT